MACNCDLSTKDCRRAGHDHAYNERMRKKHMGIFEDEKSAAAVGRLEAIRSAEKVKSYYGGEITEEDKAAHEGRLAELLSRADQIPCSLNNVMAQYRKFVGVAGQQREPFVTGNHKADQRLLAAIGNSGESGEVNNHIKKLMFRKKVGGGDISAEDREKIISELGDEFWYFMLKLIAFDIEFPDVVFGNMRKLVKRGR